MSDVRDYNPDNNSVLGRLLEELSWVGSTIKAYRQGGRGYENVLTAEVFQALDFLPRSAFMGEIIRRAHGANATRNILFQEIEVADFCLLPGNHYLIPSGESHQTKLPVQPDGLLETPSVYALLEAKRIRASSFQPEQLSRQYVLALRESKGKYPLIFLILGEQPPLKISKHGRHSINSAIELYLDSVLQRAERHSISRDEAVSKIDEVVCWITWHEISEIVKSQKELVEIENLSLSACIERLSESVIRSIDWHK